MLACKKKNSNKPTESLSFYILLPSVLSLEKFSDISILRDPVESQTRYWQWNACYLILFSPMEAWSDARFKIYLLPKLGPFLRNALTFSNLRNKSGSYCRSGKIPELYLLLNASIHNTNLWIVDQLLFDIFLNPVLLSYFWKKNLYNRILKRTRRFIFSTFIPISIY